VLRDVYGQHLLEQFLMLGEPLGVVGFVVDVM
jgi:hypothetical protein